MQGDAATAMSLASEVLATYTFVDEGVIYTLIDNIDGRNAFIMQVWRYKGLERKEFKQFVQSKFPKETYPQVVPCLMTAYWKVTGIKNPHNRLRRGPKPKKEREPHRLGQPGSVSAAE